jgi:hypothetical protein
MFRKDDAYYALLDTTCCFCVAGTGARVYEADSPLGPYKQIGNINRDKASKPIIHSQQTFVATIPTQSGPALLWMSDRWGSRPDGIKGHDFQYWLLLTINPDGTLASLKDTPRFQLAVQRGVAPKAAEQPYTWRDKSDPHPLTVDACTRAKLTEEEQGVRLTPDE